VERTAALYGAVYNLVNYVVPAGTAPGLASITAKSGDRFIAEADLEIEAVAPSLFYATQVVRLRNGIQTIEQAEFGVVDMGPKPTRCI
jgi:hypothetical protein